MKYAFTTRIVFAKESERDIIQNCVNINIADKPRWGITTVEPFISEETGYGLTATIRFTEKPSLRDLFDKVKTKLRGFNILSANITQHTCFHDEQPTKPCTIDEIYTYP